MFALRPASTEAETPRWTQAKTVQAGQLRFGVFGQSLRSTLALLHLVRRGLGTDPPQCWPKAPAGGARFSPPAKVWSFFLVEAEGSAVTLSMQQSRIRAGRVLCGSARLNQRAALRSSQREATWTVAYQSGRRRVQV